MKKNKFTKIKNRTAYIHDLIIELEDVIKEAELTETLNTSKEGRKTLNDAPVLVGSVVNELDGYEEEEERKTHCFVKYAVGTVVILTIVYLLLIQ